MDKQIQISINKIKELEFSMTQNEDISKEEVQLGFNVGLNIDHEKKTIDFQLSFDIVDSNTNAVCVHIKVSNVFFVENLQEFKKEDGTTYDIPDNGLVTMLSLSISHTRALLSKNTQGTVYASFLIPIVNPVEIMKQIFHK